MLGTARHIPSALSIRAQLLERAAGHIGMVQAGFIEAQFVPSKKNFLFALKLQLHAHGQTHSSGSEHRDAHSGMLPVVVPSLRSAVPKGRGERARVARGPAHLGAVIGSRPGRAAADFPSLRGLRSRFGSLKGIGFSVHICSGALVKCDLKRIFSSLIVFVLFFLKRIFCP